MLNELAAAIGVKKAVVVAAFIGSIVAMLIGPWRKWTERAINFGVGLPSALYLTHPLVTHFELRANEYEGGVGFMLGCFAWVIADKFVQLIRDAEFSSLLSIFKRGK